MNILRKLTLRDLKLNKKRTIGTLVGIILSCALIMVVLGMFISLFHTLLQEQINNNGYYHLRVNNVEEKDINKFKSKDSVKEVVVTDTIGYTYLEKNSSYIGKVTSMSKDTFDKLSYHLLEGEYPKNENELLINRSFKYTYDLSIGDYYELELGDATDEERLYDSELIDSKTIKYKIVGILDRYNDLVTVNTTPKSYNAYIILKNPSNYKTDIPDILDTNIFKGFDSDYDEVYVNKDVILLETFDFSEQVMRIFMTMVGIVLFIIIVTSIFSIRNSFAISITEKMKTYGMLSSVGATKKQIIRMVIYEAFIIGLVGIVLGILLGLLVNVLLIFIINTIAENANLFADGTRMLYKFSWMPIILSVVLSIVVILISSLTCAIKASRVSPIQNIRNSDNIKRKKIRCPKFIRRLFGIGGVLSYKNLKRSKKKYRVTVISLTISIFIYIIVSSFVEYSLNIIHEEYGTKDYNIQVTLYNEGDISSDYIESVKEYMIKRDNKVKEIEKLDKAYTQYGISYSDEEVDFVNHIISDNIKYRWDNYEHIQYSMYLYNDNAFKEYIKKLNLKYDDVKDKLIVIDEYKDILSKKRNEYVKLTDYKSGDIIRINNTDVKVAFVTRECPIGLDENYNKELILIGSYENYPIKDSENIYFRNIYFDSDEPYKFTKTLTDLGDDYVGVDVYNYAEAAAQTRSIMLIVSIIVYGFILVVTFIGITSVFNTINSNMELRKKDFASLKSIGMTKKEFNNMINLEAVFYSLKSLIYGIVLGLIGSYGIFKLFTRDYEFVYMVPIKSIIIAILFIIVIVLIIMRYSIKKINKQNIIETIRNSNI